jgi:murein DD-endopeptidase MepM/ murein hydrolase activator NlpD
MQILLIPGDNGRSSKTCFNHRQVLILGVFLLFVLPITVGLLTYHAKATIDRALTPRLDPEYLATLERSVVEQKGQVEAAQLHAQTHLNALATRLGHIQAQVMRVNALGQRLTDMAGLDKGEFNFSEEPALGGPERPAPPLKVQVPDFARSLEGLAEQVEQKYDELALLEALLMDKQLQAALNPVGWPVVGGYISSNYGYRRDPFNGRRAFHEGVDIANRSGAGVKAIASGVVTHAGNKAGYGLLVEINHGNGYTTRYAHTSEALVKVGDKVLKGQAIAMVGSSGRSTGPHLHFEILRNGKQINPRTYLRASR